LPAEWTNWFGLRVENQPNGDALLLGELRDQAALHAVLRQIYNLGLTLIAVNRVESAGCENAQSQAEETADNRSARERQRPSD
jgi:hypothetical protein